MSVGATGELRLFKDTELPHIKAAAADTGMAYEKVTDATEQGRFRHIVETGLGWVVVSFAEPASEEVCTKFWNELARRIQSEAHTIPEAGPNVEIRDSGRDGSYIELLAQVSARKTVGEIVQAVQGLSNPAV